MTDLAGKTIKIVKGSLKDMQIKIEDTWLKVFGSSWMFAKGNPAALMYAVRSATDNLPTDDKVWYGKISGAGHLVHESELI